MLKKINRTKQKIIFSALLFTALKGKGQQVDTTKGENFSFHGQTTVITQYKPAFYAKYTGAQSLLPTEETQTSITATLFAGAKLWKGASVFLDPEITGGAGLSQVFGLGDPTNGETYRVGSPQPFPYIARLFYRQVFALNSETSYQATDQDQLGGRQPTSYFAFTVGKVSLADYFDDNTYAHDPRTQFMDWSFMDMAAWDYPANTRGYTPSIVLEYVTPKNELRYAISLEPYSANGSDMDWHVNKANGNTLEYTRHYLLKGKNGSFRILSYLNTANMGDYNEAIARPIELAPNVISTREYGRIKYGFGINAEQAITKHTGVFFRAGWDDGHTETWTFTEVDHTASGGFSFNGEPWKRPGDNIGLGYVISGLSTPHRDYLAVGGYGFQLGDGALSYGYEQVTELYYSAELVKNNIFITGTYQFLLNPGYNTVRGPVNVFSIRIHLAI